MYIYCEDCRKAWQEDVNNHPNHDGSPLEFPGIYLLQEFLTLEEEKTISEEIYKTPFVDSQSGRRKQVYLMLYLESEFFFTFYYSNNVVKSIYM